MSQRNYSGENTGHTPEAIADTNTLYSGILYEGLESDLLDLAAEGRVVVRISEYILDELTRVLEEHGIRAELAVKSMEYGKIQVTPEDEIRKNKRFQEYLAESKKLIADAKDRPIYVFAKLMMEGHPNAYLVTGDSDLMKGDVTAALWGRVLTTRELIKRIIAIP